ncbi:MAG TPA: LCP family protein, partial [Streptosporangiaceae bacterium]
MRQGGSGIPTNAPHSPAQRRLREHLAAARRARRRRLFLGTCAALSGVVMLLSATAWSLASYVNGSIQRIAAGTAGGDSRGPLNILVAGVDLRTGLTRGQARALHVGHAVTANADTLMLAHISADRSRVTVISFPRDSWVDIPGHGMNKINAAFGLGGPKLVVATIEHDTGLTINHYVEVNFLGFVRVIDALGGVNVCLPRPVNDPYSGMRLSAGVHHVNGITALKYARDRHSFPMSDLARIYHQQSLLSSLLRETISSQTLANPVRLSQVLQA